MLQIRIPFKTKMKLLGSPEKDIDQNKNGELVPILGKKLMNTATKTGINDAKNLEINMVRI